jgi:cation diffusion facilitator family transporter
MIKSKENLKLYAKPYFINLILLTFNGGMFISKFIVALLTQSLALQADAFDNLTDLVMVLSSFIGILYSNKKPNKKFPRGYYRIENVISLVISVVIFFTAYRIITESIAQIINFINGKLNPVLVSLPAIIFLFISLGLSLSLTIYLKLVGRLSGSPIIESEVREKLYDNLISLSVLIGFIAASLNLFLLDPILGLIIAFVMISGGYDIFKNSTKVLLDSVIDFDKRRELYAFIENFPRIKDIKSLEIRAYGRYIFIEVEIVLNKDMPLSQINSLKSKLSKKIKSEFPKIFKVIIVPETEAKPTTKIAVPLAKNENLESPVFDHYGEAPYFALLEFEEDSLVSYEIVPNKFKDKEKRKGILISDWLSAEKIDKVYTRTPLKRGAKLVFQNSFIQAETTEAEILKDIVEVEKLSE